MSRTSAVNRSVTDRSYRVTKLAAEFDLTTFDCGEPAYNQWLSEHARTAVESGCALASVSASSATTRSVPP